jgi:quercetin dioxygenase-like cupin family protein
LPLIFEPERDRIYKQGEGWKVTTMADHTDVGTAALLVRRWSLQARVSTPQALHEGHEEMLYVMRGNGEAIVGNQRLELSAESMLWLEPGDSYQLIAGEEGLEILQGCA